VRRLLRLAPVVTLNATLLAKVTAETLDAHLVGAGATPLPAPSPAPGLCHNRGRCRREGVTCLD